MATDNKSTPVFEIGIKRIKQLEFSIDETIDVLPNKEVNINIQQVISNSPEDSTITLVLNVTFTEKSTNKMLMKCLVENVFLVKELKQMVSDVDPTVLNVPDGILTTMLSISISHTRALIAQSAMGS